LNLALSKDFLKVMSEDTVSIGPEEATGGLLFYLRKIKSYGVIIGV